MLRMSALLIVASCLPAMAQSNNCGPRDMIIGQLAEHYGESVIGSGLNGNNQLVETYANTETGTWTITATRADGVMCALSAGEHFQIHEQIQGEPT